MQIGGERSGSGVALTDGTCLAIQFDLAAAGQTGRKGERKRSSRRKILT